jgi:hypothetical protein
MQKLESKSQLDKLHTKKYLLTIRLTLTYHLLRESAKWELNAKSLI